MIMENILLKNILLKAFRMCQRIVSSHFCMDIRHKIKLSPLWAIRLHSASIAIQQLFNNYLPLFQAVATSGHTTLKHIHSHKPFPFLPVAILHFWLYYFMLLSQPFGHFALCHFHFFSVAIRHFSKLSSFLATLLYGVSMLHVLCFVPCATTAAQ